MLIEKAALGALRRFQLFFSEFLAEDFVIGEAFENSGFKLSCSFAWIDNVNRSTTTREASSGAWSRWAKLRLRFKPGFYVMEMLPESRSPFPWLCRCFSRLGAGSSWPASWLLKVGD